MYFPCRIAGLIKLACCKIAETSYARAPRCACCAAGDTDGVFCAPSTLVHPTLGGAVVAKTDNRRVGDEMTADKDVEVGSAVDSVVVVT